MKQLFYLFACVLFLTACSGGSQLSTNEKYPKDWREAQTHEAFAISRVLSLNGISGCGRYYVKSYIDGGDEYLVACTEDNLSWTYYKVWISTREITPIDDSTLAAPELHRIAIPQY